MIKNFNDLFKKQKKARKQDQVLVMAYNDFIKYREQVAKLPCRYDLHGYKSLPLEEVVNSNRRYLQGYISCLLTYGRITWEEYEALDSELSIKRDRELEEEFKKNK